MALDSYILLLVEYKRQVALLVVGREQLALDSCNRSPSQVECRLELLLVVAHKRGLRLMEEYTHQVVVVPGLGMELLA